MACSRYKSIRSEIYQKNTSFATYKNSKLGADVLNLVENLELYDL